MARKSNQSISYVLSMPDPPGGHRLGVNGLAVDRNNSILYSAGRDGIICAWDLNFDLYSSPPENAYPKPEQKTTFRRQVEAHSHWINDIILASHNSLVTASSDTAVRLWRPLENADDEPATLGRHADFAKCLATPQQNSDWVVSGGLDRRIYLWDINGGGERLRIDNYEDESDAKGSVYVLGARPSVLASGGPESVVRVWDPRSGKQITKFVGHTDNIRGILINENGDTIMSASSDRTVKVWSLTAGRCMHTLTMHNDSVWSLYSDHPQLSVFYSGDRSGFVAKTDTRYSPDVENGMCVSVLQENDGVLQVAAAGNYLWTATQSSRIHRFRDVDTTLEVDKPNTLFRNNPFGSTTQPPIEEPSTKPKIPHYAILPLVEDPSLVPTSPIGSDADSVSEEFGQIKVVRHHPEETVQGQDGLIKYEMLNDRKRALTQDTAGEVVLWDILRCRSIKSFGKRHLDEVADELNTDGIIANWCSLDIRTGRLAVTLELNRCFDGEVYADEADLEDIGHFKDDHRINLGKWVLRWLFKNVIEEEMRRDEAFRTHLKMASTKAGASERSEVSDSIEFPKITVRSTSSHLSPSALSDEFASASVGRTFDASATDSPGALMTALPESTGYRNSNETNDHSVHRGLPIPGANSKLENEAASTSPATSEKEKPSSSKRSRFGRFFPKRLGRSSNEAKPAVEEKPPSDKSSEKEKVFGDSFKGVVDKIHSEYEEELAQHPEQGLETRIRPTSELDTPDLGIPGYTTVLIREENADSAAAADLYRGTVGKMAADTDKIRLAAPKWLGEFLLRNIVPTKDTSKIAFSLRPYDDLLPPVTKSDASSRLNANRMLRAKKILSYIAENIDPIDADHPETNLLRPEDYLELYCQNQLIPPNMTLSTIRTHIWRAGSDIALYYKTNGKRDILFRANSHSHSHSHSNSNSNSNSNSISNHPTHSTSFSRSNHSTTPSHSHSHSTSHSAPHSHSTSIDHRSSRSTPRAASSSVTGSEGSGSTSRTGSAALSWTGRDLFGRGER